MALAYIGLGSNLGARESNFLRAVEELRAVGTIVQISTVYETKPQEMMEPQPDFLNAVVEVETEHSPRPLLETLLRIEKELGRIRIGPGRAREIDLDLIAWADQVVSEPDLIVPHPRMHLRDFVLEPMVELAPGWLHPLLKQTTLEMLAAL